MEVDPLLAGVRAQPLAVVDVADEVLVPISSGSLSSTMSSCGESEIDGERGART